MAKVTWIPESKMRQIADDVAERFKDFDHKAMAEEIERLDIKITVTTNHTN